MRNVLYICLDICNKLCYTMKCVLIHLLMEADLIKINLINAFCCLNYVICSRERCSKSYEFLQIIRGTFINAPTGSDISVRSD